MEELESIYGLCDITYAAPSFSLVDLLYSKSFNFTKPERDINSMISTFNKAGITSKRLTPGYIAWDTANEQQRLTDEATQTDLRLVGIGLGSFFASIYHSGYRKNKGVTELNRYAVIHCASASS